MTEEQKEILIAKMLDAPSSLSDEELESILHDEELCSIYEASAAVSNACIRQPELDMEAEWNRFRPRLRHKPSMMHWTMQVAAIFLGVLIASSIVIRIIDNVFTTEQKPVIAKVEQSQETNNVPEVIQSPQLSDTKEEVHQESSIKKCFSTVSKSHLSKAEINHPKTNTIQDGSDIDVDEYLRIQQARVDNDLAMQVAESYMEEYDDLVAILDAVGVYNPSLDNVVRKVTME